MLEYCLQDGLLLERKDDVVVCMQMNTSRFGSGQERSAGVVGAVGMAGWIRDKSRQVE